jgi:hypothetical protein
MRNHLHLLRKNIRLIALVVVLLAAAGSVPAFTHAFTFQEPYVSMTVNNSQNATTITLGQSVGIDASVSGTGTCQSLSGQINGPYRYGNFTQFASNDAAYYNVSVTPPAVGTYTYGINCASNGWGSLNQGSSQYQELSIQATVTVNPATTQTQTVTASATVTVTQAAPTATLVANPTSITSGNSSTLSYTCTNSTSASITGIGAVTPASGGSVSVSPTTTTSYTLTCTGPGGSATNTASVTVTLGSPDLTVTQAPTPATATVGTPQTFTGSIQNIGTGAASNVPNVLEVADSSFVPVWPYTATSPSTVSVAVGTPTAVSGAYTFSSGGTYNVRFCANMNTLGANVVSESNYGNNCGPWQAVTVASNQITASCSVSPTTVAANAPVTWKATATGGSGTLTYTWSGTGVSGTGSSVSETYSSAGTYSGQVTVTDSSGDTSGAVPCTTNGGGQSGGSSVTVYSCVPALTANPSTINVGGTSVLTWSENAICASSCTFSDGHTAGLSGTYTVSPPTPTSGNTDTYSVTCPLTTPANTNQTAITVNSAAATISASPNRVSPGGSTTVTWSSVDTLACTITRNGGAFATGTSGSQGDTVTTQTVYKITCTTAGSPVSATAVVNILPAFQEF